MADTKISELTAATSVAAADVFPLVQSGTTKKATLSVLAASINAANGVINVRDYGAVGDGETDDTAAIQAAIDAALVSKQGVFLPAGQYLISDTLHAGYGAEFSSVVIEGAGYRYRGEAGFSGTAIIPTFSDRPAIAIQGARGTVLRGIAIRGLNYTHIHDNGLGGFTPAFDDTDPDNWVDPLLHENADSRYAPYAGVAIDPYSGTKPAVAYPDVTFPEGSGISEQYGKKTSSDVLLEDMHISGFVVGVVNQPCDHDANGEFTSLRRVHIEACKYGVSIGNSQSRSVSMLDCDMAMLFVAFTNNTHGKQIGKFGGTITNLSVGQTIHLLKLRAVYAAPMVFQTIYAELLWRIGDVTFQSSNEGAFTFIGGEFVFTAQTEGRGIPANVLDTLSPELGMVHFEGTHFWGFPSVIAFHALPTMKRCKVGVIERAEPYEKYAHNLLCGGMVGYELRPDPQAEILHDCYNLDTGSSIGVRSSRLLARSNRPYCIPLYTHGISCYNLRAADSLPTPHRIYSIDRAALSSCTRSGKELTLVFSSLDTWAAMSNGLMPGDVLVDRDTGMTAFIKSRSTTTVVAEIQNNIVSDGEGGYDLIEDVDLGEGYFFSAVSRYYTPTYPLMGTTTQGNSAISDCHRSTDQYSAWYESEILAGDLFVSTRQETAPFPEYQPTISARDHTAKTITMEGNAVRSLPIERLKFFVRQAPANPA